MNYRQKAYLLANKRRQALIDSINFEELKNTVNQLSKTQRRISNILNKCKYFGFTQKMMSAIIDKMDGDEEAIENCIQDIMERIDGHKVDIKRWSAMDRFNGSRTK